MKTASKVIESLEKERSSYGRKNLLEDRIEAIKGRMICEEARNTSDQEIERCLTPTIGGNKMVRLAKELRERGLLIL